MSSQRTLLSRIVQVGVAIIAISLTGAHVRVAARDAKDPKAQDAPPAAEPQQQPGATQELTELEKEFEKTFRKATLSGHWRLSQGDELGEEREELYQIDSVKKAGKDLWLFNGVRVKYGGKDVTVPFPIPVKVLWAGDTPVISVTDLNVPGLGTYTARVLVYRGIYTGTWFGPGHGGSMSGRILKKDAAQPTTEKKPKDA